MPARFGAHLLRKLGRLHAPHSSRTSSEPARRPSTPCSSAGSAEALATRPTSCLPPSMPRRLRCWRGKRLRRPAQRWRWARQEGQGRGTGAAASADD